jgi:hypothetical protein
MEVSEHGGTPNNHPKKLGHFQILKPMVTMVRISLHFKKPPHPIDNPIGSMYGIYANIGGILMVNVTIYSIHGSYGNIQTFFHHGDLDETFSSPSFTAPKFTKTPNLGATELQGEPDIFWRFPGDVMVMSWL